jgi:hypothetical protein
MLLGMNVPVRSWVALFKPTTWGYFVSPDFGLSWHWQFRVYLLLGAAFAFFVTVMGASQLIALWGALCLAWSSFFAYWSYISEPLIGMGLLAAVLVYRQMLPSSTSSRWGSSRWRWAEALLLVWVLVVFCVNNLYPPFQVPMVYFVMAIGAYALWLHRSVAGVLRVGLALLLALGIVGIHFYENLPVLHKILGTEYPGLRVSTGGDLSLGRMLIMSFFALSGYSGFPDLNISEAGSSFFVGLVTPILFLWSWRRLARPAAASLGIVLLALTLFLGVYCFIGMPEWFVKLSGWSRVPGPRTLGLWTLLNVCWLVWWVQYLPSYRLLEHKSTALGAVGLSLILLAWGAVGDLQSLTWSKVLMGALLMGVVGGVLLWRPRVGMWLVLCVIAAGSLWFNPVDRNSYSKIVSMPRVQKLREDFLASGKEALLLLDGDVRTANFLRMIGIPSFGGMHFVPQVEFWKRFDPEMRYSKQWNRFAHVNFRRAAAGQATFFEAPQGDVLTVYLSDSDIRILSEKAWVLDRLW